MQIVTLVLHDNQYFSISGTSADPNQNIIVYPTHINARLPSGRCVIALELLETSSFPGVQPPTKIGPIPSDYGPIFDIQPGSYKVLDRPQPSSVRPKSEPLLFRLLDYVTCTRN